MEPPLAIRSSLVAVEPVRPRYAVQVSERDPRRPTPPWIVALVAFAFGVFAGGYAISAAYAAVRPPAADREPPQDQ